MSGPVSIEQRVEVLDAELTSVRRELKAILVELRAFLLLQSAPFHDATTDHDIDRDDTD